MKKIVVLAHVLDPEVASDAHIVEALQSMFSKNDRVVFIADLMLASQAREILGGSYFVVTGRMHAAISTFQTVKPAIALSYSVKYKGVITNDLDLGTLVVESKGNDIWINSIVDDVYISINDLMNGYDNYINKIDKKVSEAKVLAMKNIEFFISHL